MFWATSIWPGRLDTRQPVFGFSSRGLDGRAEFDTIEDMAAQYVNDLRVVQPRGLIIWAVIVSGKRGLRNGASTRVPGEKVACWCS